MSLNEVQEKVLQLESAIKRLDTVKRHLNRNAADIKADIHTSVSRNLECLRSREVTLLSQVDQVLRVKEETLQHQQARLNQSLGVLRTGLSMILDQTASERQLTETLEKLNRIELSPEETPYISFRANHMSLRESILTYGRVDASGLPPLIAFNDPGNPSASLPRHVEDYEDADHHIFYKTLEEVKRTKTSNSNGRTITVAIPKLSNRVEDWLQKKVPSSGARTEVSEAAARHLPAIRPSLLAKSGDMPSASVSGTSTPGSSCSLNNWLSLIKQHADLEEEHDFEIFDNSCAQKAAAVRSSEEAAARSSEAAAAAMSSEVPAAVFQTTKEDLRNWLSSASTCVSKFSSTFFKHVPTDSKFWLTEAGHQLTDIDELKQKDFFHDVSREPTTWLRSRAYVKQQLSSQEVKDARGDMFSHISQDQENWLQVQTKTAVQKDVIDKVDMSGNTNKNNCRTSSKKEDDGKWLLRCAVSTPVFQLEDICQTSELCANISKCASQPDCLKLCCKDKSPIKYGVDPPHAFQPKSLTHEWPSLISYKQTKQSFTAEGDKEGSSLFSHIPDVGDSIWLMKSQSSSTLDVPKSLSSDVFKDNKEEANLWLQKKGSTCMQDLASPVNVKSTSSSIDFCMSDWLLVPAKDKEECLDQELDQNKNESEI
jgi:hypothetical protein